MADLKRFEQSFDIMAPENYGKPRFFDINHYLDSVEQMIAADEIIFALQMLENMPGFYRDNIPERAKEIKAKLYQNLMIETDYAHGDQPDITNPALLNRFETLACAPRAGIIYHLIHQLNQQNVKPTIIEFGPYDYWLPIGAKYTAKLEFDYLPITLDSETLHDVQAEYDQINFVQKPGAFNMFICCEVIEHMWTPEDIIKPLLKMNVDPEIVVISTPLYALAHGLENWDERELGHVRTWTPKELVAFAEKLFDGRKWTHVREFSQVLVGMKANNP